jgi:putative glutamine amidotransferase
MAQRIGRPIVGICADRSMSGPHPIHSVGEKYIMAIVEGAGALAVLLPALGERQRIEDILGTVDGLLFTGSYSNVEPARYGGPASAEGTLHDPARDSTALPLLRAAVDAGVPVLAICRGHQEMNVAFGGTLHQRVYEVDGLDDHREDKGEPLDVQYSAAHAVRLTPGGLLSGLMNGASEAQVNSLHGQGIDRLGEGLSIEAQAPDGLVEAVGMPGARGFVLGLQWHPEWQFASNPLSSAIFSAFGEACRARQDASAVV